MMEFTIPESWGEFETQATQAFALGKDDVLALLHDIQRCLCWAGEDRYNLIFCAGWLEGMLHARRELERTQKYPDSIRDLDSMLDSVGDDYQSDLIKEGRRMGLQVNFSLPNSRAEAMPEAETMEALEILVEQDIYPRSVPVAMFILFSESINPGLVYHKYIDGFSLAYTNFFDKNKTDKNTVTRFLCARMPKFHENFIFINDYVFESDSSKLIINAKLFMNPIREKSVLRLINENDDSIIAEVDVINRLYNELYAMNGKEEDYLKAGGLLLGSLAGIEDEILKHQIGKQASKKIVSMVADDLSAVIGDVYDKPFAENVKKLAGFTLVSIQYKNFIAPNGYDELIREIRQYVSPINGLSDVLFTELTRLLNELRKIADS